MATGANTVSVVRAGYWIFGRDSNRPVADIPSELFTHLYAGFAKVGDDDRVFPDPPPPQFQEFTPTVRQRNPNVKTLLSIGGEGADLSAVVANRERRENLIRDSIDTARMFGFDGLDLCWLYPSNAGLENPLASLLIEWHDAIKPYNLLLTAAVFHHPGIRDRNGNITFNYPIQAINENLNWINVLAIDFYTPSNSSEETGPVHAWRNPREQNWSGSAGITEWIDRGVVAKKVVLGLPFYGYEWMLENPNSFSGLFAPAHPSNNILRKAYIDIQEELRSGIYETVYDSTFDAVYSHKINGEKWIGYDDGLCIFGKVREARNRKLRGYFAWRVGADDVNWTLSRSAFESWPLR